MFSWFSKGKAKDEPTLPLHAPPAVAGNVKQGDKKQRPSSLINLDELEQTSTPVLATTSPKTPVKADKREQNHEQLSDISDFVPTEHDAKLEAIHGDIHSIKDAIPSYLRTGPDSSTPDALYDPFTGELRETFQATPMDRERSRSNSIEPETADTTSQSSANLWAQLAKIRELQSEISRLHVQMEGVGSHGRGRHRRKNRSRTDLGLGGESEEEDVNFQQLAGKFKGKEQDIDKIMSKLDELSQAVVGFHHIQMPTFQVNTPLSPANTLDSMTLASDPGSSHSPFHKSPMSLSVPPPQSPSSRRASAITPLATAPVIVADSSDKPSYLSDSPRSLKPELAPP